MKIITLLIATVLFAACTSSAPTMQEGPNAEVSFDGLHLIDNARFAQAWADPDIDFSRYKKVMGGGATFEFRAVKNTGTRTSQSRRGTSEFYIDDRDREKLEQTVNEIFDEELANSTRFEMTDTKGEDVLVIRGALHDIVSNVPPELMGRGEIYLSAVGEATLIIEGLDSMSGEVIFRAIERRAAQRPGGTAIMANTVTTWAEVRRLARRWAQNLTDGLDSIPES